MKIYKLYCVVGHGKNVLIQFCTNYYSIFSISQQVFKCAWISWKQKTSRSG